MFSYSLQSTAMLMWTKLVVKLAEHIFNMLSIISSKSIQSSKFAKKACGISVYSRDYTLQSCFFIYY
jgi:hypothetical protein